MRSQLLFKKLKEAMQNKDYRSVKEITKELVELGFSPNPKIISEYNVITGQRIEIISIDEPKEINKEVAMEKIKELSNNICYRNTIHKNGEDDGAYAD